MTVHIPFNVRCLDCEAVWTAVYYPKAVALFAEIVTAGRCPYCGATCERQTHTDDRPAPPPEKQETTDGN